jgi:hypothetical protein
MIDSTNYDERYVGNHPLPELLEYENGTKVGSSWDWETIRRTELLNLFESQVYGKAPSNLGTLNHEVMFTDANALNGLAIRQEIHIYSGENKTGIRIDLQLYTPKNSSVPVPTFLGCNFNGNHAVDPNPEIPINHRWMRTAPDEKNVVNHCATEFSRGSESSRWPLELIISNGFGVATFYYGDVEPDHAQGWKSGIRGQYLAQNQLESFATDSWGAIAAWSWGLRRALDYLTTKSLVDAEKIAVIGHSRLGKAALWAAALDQRFAMAISNNSGAGGISLARRNFGESIEHLNENFPHWFCENFKAYNGQPEKLPVDMHQLVALIAPRPLYIASAEEDLWADPKGEFLAGKHAEPAYNLFGRVGIGAPDWPPINHPVGENIGYHIRSGKHDVTTYDWQQFIQFATKHFRKP